MMQPKSLSIYIQTGRHASSSQDLAFCRQSKSFTGMQPSCTVINHCLLHHCEIINLLLKQHRHPSIIITICHCQHEIIATLLHRCIDPSLCVFFGRPRRRGGETYNSALNKACLLMHATSWLEITSFLEDPQTYCAISCHIITH